MSRCTAGSAPSLTVIPAVVWRTNRWQTPLLTFAFLTSSLISAVMSISSVRARLLTSIYLITIPSR